MAQAVSTYLDLRRAYKINLPDNVDFKPMTYERASKSYSSNSADSKKALRFTAMMDRVRSLYGQRGVIVIDAFDQIVHCPQGLGYVMTPERKKTCADAISMIRTALEKPRATRDTLGGKCAS
jgi:hypothetical protein